VVASPGFVTAAAQVMAALGARGAVHLRAPALPVRMVLAHAERLARIQELSGCWLVVNDRVDLALAAGARGAQLTSRSLRPADARRVAPALRLGASVHALDAAVEAEREGADWVVVGHVFETESHPGEPGRGGEFLARVAATVRVPAVAIGGVTPERVGALVAAGARGVAAIRGIWEAPHAGDAVGRYLSAYDAHDAEGGR
jgi:thiamine-phosphate diphosphorylase